MDNREIAGHLEMMATLMELIGENAFRCRAYANAARRVETLQDPVADLVASGTLDQVKGIGKGLSENISELVLTGSMTAHEKMKVKVPEGLLEMTEIPGLGAKRVRAIFESLGVSDVDALDKACERGEVEQLSGFGKKTADKIRQGIGFLQKHRGLYLCSTAQLAAEGLRDHLAAQPGVGRVAIVGSVRRCTEMTKDVGLLATADDPRVLADAFTAHGDVVEVTARSEARVSVLLAAGMVAELEIVDEAGFPHALYHSTGSREHTTRMQTRARGLVL